MCRLRVCTHKCVCLVTHFTLTSTRDKLGPACFQCCVTESSKVLVQGDRASRQVHPCQGLLGSHYRGRGRPV